MRWIHPIVLLALLALAGCGPGDSPTPSVVTIGAEGGTVEVEGAILRVPPGALSEPTEITVARRELAVPEGISAYSPVFELSPDGLTFHLPATVELEFDGDPSRAEVYWSTSSGSYRALESTVSGDRAVAMVTHFSAGFVGAAGSTLPVDGGAADGGVVPDGGVPGSDGGPVGAVGELLWTNPSGTGGLSIVANETSAYWATPNGNGILSIEHTSSAPSIVVPSGSAKVIALDGDWIYGLHTDSVYRWPTGGGARETVVDRGIESSPVNVLVARGNHLAVSTLESLILVALDNGQRFPLASNALPVALTDSHVYWVYSQLRARSLINSEETSLASGLGSSTKNLAVEGGLVYYDATYMPDGATLGHAIYSVPVAGGAPAMVVETELNPRRLAVDGEYLYWLDSTGVSRAPRAGGARETVVAISGTDYVVMPTDMAIGGAHVYWTNGLGEVRRQPLP